MFNWNDNDSDRFADKVLALEDPQEEQEVRDHLGNVWKIARYAQNEEERSTSFLMLCEHLSVLIIRFTGAEGDMVETHVGRRAA